MLCVVVPLAFLPLRALLLLEFPSAVPGLSVGQGSQFNKCFKHQHGGISINRILKISSISGVSMC